jgi:hypothetical protein
MNVLSGITGAAAIPKFATGGYVQGGIYGSRENAGKVYGSRSDPGQIYGSDVNRGWISNKSSGAWWVTRKVPSPVSSIATASRTVNVNVPINAQPVAPDMFLINGSEVRRMALEVAQQAIGQNNAQQRQPSARRRAGR